MSDGSNNSYQTRDERCAADVGRMARLGRFAVEFDAYGCTYIDQQGELCYRVSSNELKLFDFIIGSALQGIWPTPMDHFVYRTPVPSDMREQIQEETKMKLVYKMKAQYVGLYELLQPLAIAAPNDASLPLLEQMVDEIDGHFNDSELQLLEGAMQFAYQSKVLTKESHRVLTAWVHKVRYQMADDPVVKDNFGRTFYGFGYVDEAGTLQYFFDAQKMAVFEKQLALELQGLLVFPLFVKEYWFKGFDQMDRVKGEFLAELSVRQDRRYLELFQQIQALPGVIAEADFLQAKEALMNIGSAEALTALDYYGRRWNRSK